MKRLKRIVLVFSLLALLIPTSLLAKERRVALVIGNGAYKDAPLRNPVNDATDMASALKDLGFEVTLKTDADQRSIEESIRQFGNDLRSGGVGLFYFAGHGIQHSGINYLIPVQANIKSEADVKYEAVDAGRVLAQMENAGNGLNIIILDACRNNPFARSFRNVEQGLARMDAPVGSLLAYSTAPGSVAHDGTGRNGLYTSKLLAHLKTSGLKLEDFFKKVRQDVVIESLEMGSKQIPWESSSVMIDFYLVPSKGDKSKGVASVDQTVSKPQEFETRPEINRQRFEEPKRLRIAILPWELKGQGDYYVSMVLDKLVENIDKFEGLELTHSYYAIGNSSRALRIKTDELQALVNEKLFRRKNLFAASNLDLMLLEKIGRELNVDILVTMKFHVKKAENTWDNECELLRIYLYDVVTKEVIEKSIENRLIAGGEFDTTSLFSSAFSNFMKRIKQKG